MIPALPAGRKRIITRYRVVVSALLAVAAALLYIGFVSSVDHKTETNNAAHVSFVQPEPNAVALRQARIFASLDTAYTGTLIVEGIEIPEAQLDHLEGLNTVGFTPRAGTETGALKPGKRCARVVYWPLASSRSEAMSYDWCWTAH